MPFSLPIPTASSSNSSIRLETALFYASTPLCSVRKGAVHKKRTARSFPTRKTKLLIFPVRALIGDAMKCWFVSLHTIRFFAVGLVLLSSCQRNHPTDPTQDDSRKTAVAVPPDLHETVSQLTRAIQTFDISRILEVYAEDFLSGSGRSKEDIRNVFVQLRTRNVKLEVEKAIIETVEDKGASLRTQIRLRYMDHFRSLGEGEVVITDVLRHELRKNELGWQIHADDRVSTYREGRFGPHSPNVQLDVPNQLPATFEYTATVTVRQEQETQYRVMIGNYAEDPTILPPPDLVLPLPEDGILHVRLLPNLQKRGEMVRLTIIAANQQGEWLGATTISKFVPGIAHEREAEKQKRL